MVRNSSSMKTYINKMKILGHLCSGPTAATAKYETICIHCLCIFSGFLYAQKAKYQDIFSLLPVYPKRKIQQTWIYIFLFTYLGKLSISIQRVFSFFLTVV